MQLQHTPQLVFVYGTLKTGYGNHDRLLAGKSKYIGACSIPGILLHLRAFPGLIKHPLCRVHGEVYEVSWETIARLDILEGTPTLYTRQQVKTPLGTCWTYYWANQDDYAELTDKTLVVDKGMWRGGSVDKAHYKEVCDFFAGETTSVVTNTNTPPAHIAREVPKALANVPMLPAPPTPPPPPPREPVVGPGLEAL